MSKIQIIYAQLLISHWCVYVQYASAANYSTPNWLCQCSCLESSCFLHFLHSDIDFSADDNSLTFSWSASDPESGIEHCEWAVGT